MMQISGAWTLSTTIGTKGMIDSMKLQKSAALFMALCLLLLAALSGCSRDPSGETSSSSESEQQKELHLLLYAPDGDASYWNAVVDAYKAQYPNVNVTSNVTGDAASIAQQQILDGNAPDLIFLPDDDGSGVTNALIQDHALVDLTDFFANLAVPVTNGTSESSQESQADSSSESDASGTKSVALWSGVLDNSSCQPYGDGKIYLAPVLCFAQGLWYNANALTADAFASWEDLAASSAALTYAGTDPRSVAPLLIPALTSYLGKSGTDNLFAMADGAWEGEMVANALAAFASVGGRVVSGTADFDDSAALAAFAEGTATVIPYSTDILKRTQSLTMAGGFAWGFAPTPIVSGADKLLPVDLQEAFIPADAVNQETAKEFLAFLYSDAVVQLAAQHLNATPPVEGASQLMEGHAHEAAVSAYALLDGEYSPYCWKFALLDVLSKDPGTDLFQPVNSVLDGSFSVSQWALNAEQMCDVLREHITQ